MSTMVGVEQVNESQSTVASLLEYATADHKQAIIQAYLTGIVTRVESYAKALRLMANNDLEAAVKLAESHRGHLDMDSYLEGFHMGCQQAYMAEARWLEQMQKDLLAVLGR